MKTLRSGTPQTLIAAIENGLDSAGVSGTLAERAIEAHVRDYLAQKFSTAMMRGSDESVDEIRKLWVMITGEKR